MACGISVLSSKFAACLLANSLFGFGQPVTFPDSPPACLVEQLAGDAGSSSCTRTSPPLDTQPRIPGARVDDAFPSRGQPHSFLLQQAREMQPQQMVDPATVTSQQMLDMSSVASVLAATSAEGDPLGRLDSTSLQGSQKTHDPNAALFDVPVAEAANDESSASSLSPALEHRRLAMRNAEAASREEAEQGLGGEATGGAPGAEGKTAYFAVDTPRAFFDDEDSFHRRPSARMGPSSLQLQGSSSSPLLLAAFDGLTQKGGTSAMINTNVPPRTFAEEMGDMGGQEPDLAENNFQEVPDSLAPSTITSQFAFSPSSSPETSNSVLPDASGIVASSPVLRGTEGEAPPPLGGQQQQLPAVLPPLPPPSQEAPLVVQAAPAPAATAATQPGPSLPVVPVEVERREESQPPPQPLPPIMPAGAPAAQSAAAAPAPMPSSLPVVPHVPPAFLPPSPVPDNVLPSAADLGVSDEDDGFDSASSEAAIEKAGRSLQNTRELEASLRADRQYGKDVWQAAKKEIERAKRVLQRDPAGVEEGDIGVDHVDGVEQHQRHLAAESMDTGNVGADVLPAAQREVERAKRVLQKSFGVAGDIRVSQDAGEHQRTEAVDSGDIGNGVFRRIDRGRQSLGVRADEGTSTTLHDHSTACHKPRCQWTCESPTCEEVCEPRCQPPRCETRCQSADVSACTMDCEHPHCLVLCPSRLCPSIGHHESGDKVEEQDGCRFCHTECSEPMCKLKCPKAQPCHSVCEQPRCDWHCRAPQRCPKPVCHMKCDQPHQSCILGATHERGSSFHDRLPSLRPGELSVASFAASDRSRPEQASFLPAR